MYKLGLEKAEEPEIKLPTFIGSRREQGNSREASTAAALTTWKPLTVWITTNCENSLRDGNTRPPYLTPEKSVCRSRNSSYNRTWNNRLVPNWERSTSVCMLLPCLFGLYAECIMRNARLDEAQGGMKIAGRNINNLRYTDDTTLMEESGEELKSCLMRLKEQSESWTKTLHSEN